MYFIITKLNITNWYLNGYTLISPELIMMMGTLFERLRAHYEVPVKLHHCSREIIFLPLLLFLSVLSPLPGLNGISAISFNIPVY